VAAVFPPNFSLGTAVTRKIPELLSITLRRGKAASAAGKNNTATSGALLTLSVLQGPPGCGRWTLPAEMPARQFVKFCRSSARSCNLANAARSPACAATPDTATAATPDTATPATPDTAAPDAATTAATAAANPG
jgi:hypothetical protein